MKRVVFADGILPGHGTSASENDEAGGDAESERNKKKKSARSKNRNKNIEKMVAITQANLALLEKEQSLLDQKVCIPTTKPIMALYSFIHIYFTAFLFNIGSARCQG